MRTSTNNSVTIAEHFLSHHHAIQDLSEIGNDINYGDKTYRKVNKSQTKSANGHTIIDAVPHNQLPLYLPMF
jgi:hypothetical protein